MILYIGNESKGYWIEEVAEKHNLKFKTIDAQLHIKNQINAILENGSCKFMVFELGQYEDDSEELASWIQKISNANKAKIIIYAEEFMLTSNAIKALYSAGIKNYIFGFYVAQKKEELELCMNGFMEANIDEAMKTSIVEQENEEIGKTEKLHNQKYIGVAGACHRMGTTTIALQIVKFLNFNGKKACYIETNDSNYVQAIGEWFSESEKDEYMGRITYSSVDMYYNPERIPEILNMDYDYFVYDYGTYSDTNFNRQSFLEKDLRIFVLGSNPWEMEKSYSVIKSSFYNNIEYVFNLVPETEHNDLLELMDDKSANTHFSVYAPDPFVLASPDWINFILSEEEKTSVPQKKGFFARKKRKV